MSLLSTRNRFSCRAINGSEHVIETVTSRELAANLSYLQAGKESSRATQSEIGVRALKKDVTV